MIEWVIYLGLVSAAVLFAAFGICQFIDKRG